MEQTQPCGLYRLRYGGHVALLVWFKREDEELRKFAADGSLKNLAGLVRNQESHVLCWAYAAGDLVSTERVIRGLIQNLFRSVPRTLLITWSQRREVKTKKQV
ncbi:unnamed protein product [Microthlaspi erraticum]|uniref:Uncharacterized protein n=1 Tax=Microthlaspi erraticum TaxID=1685480 RepID=A0A6D2J8P9_9BRAS|nr:unnamed protein product [Microthlaspi erraticum]